MSLWAEYIKEREGHETLENEFGFITYRIMPKHVFIRDMFVSPSVRNAGIGQSLFDELLDIARKAQLSHVICQVDVRAFNSTHSLGVILSRGFMVTEAHGQMITLIREVDHGRSC